jgi:CRP/FNR family transcriptional regulator
VFRRLPRKLWPQVDAGKTPQVLPAGHALFEEGAPPLAVHCIRSGSVKVFKLRSDGEEQIIRVLGPGEVVGYRAVLAGEPYGASAQTLEETAVCTIPAALLQALLERSPQFAMDVLAKVARELRVSDDFLINLQHRTVRQRLAASLLLLSETRAEESTRQRRPSVRLTRRDLARLAATTPESVSRALRRFAEERLVVCSRREIRVLDLPGLGRVAGGGAIPRT